MNSMLSDVSKTNVASTDFSLLYLLYFEIGIGFGTGVGRRDGIVEGVISDLVSNGIGDDGVWGTVSHGSTGSTCSSNPVINVDDVGNKDCKVNGWDGWDGWDGGGDCGDGGSGDSRELCFEILSGLDIVYF